MARGVGTDLFLALTPDWVLKAVEEGGFEPTGHVMALHCLENRVYDLKLEDGTHVVAKFYRPGRWSKEQIIEEHDFLYDLDDLEIPVCAPLVFDDGESLHQVEGIYYAVWPRTGGRSPEELSDEQIQVLGRLLARIHNVGAGRPFRHRRTLDANTYVREAVQLLTTQGFLPPRWAPRFQQLAEEIAKLYEARVLGVPLHRIHGDCHYGNLLHGKEGWFFLDFDDSVRGPAVQDLWLLVPGRDPESEQKRELFMEAYRQFRPFESRWLSLVEPLRAMRYIHYAAWIARRWKDPAFPSAFPHFGTEAYWEKETQDLAEQLDRCFSGDER